MISGTPGIVPNRLVWGREHAGRIVLNLRDAHLRLDDATRLCRSDATDPLHSRVRLLHCPPARPDVLENGHARATGPLDDRGRRTGAWRFFRDDGSLLAEGAYQAGAATGEWVFHPIDRNDGN